MGIALAVFCARLSGAGIVDDAYTGLRHSKNLALGFGPVFNPGERVEGYTSILWTYVPGFLGLFFSALERLIVGLSFASAGLLAWALYAASAPGRSTEERADAIGISLAIVALPGCYFWAASGMDSVLFAALVVMAIVSALWDLESGEQVHVSGRTIVWFALASLARMEALLLAAWIGVALTAFHRKLDAHWRNWILLPFCWLAALWLVITGARLAYFGELLPNTFYAKLTPDVANRIVRGIAYWNHWAVAHALLLVLAIGLCGLALRRRVISVRAVVVLGGSWLVYCAYVIWVGGDHFAMHRFLLPATGIAAALLARAWTSLQGVLSLRARNAARAAFLLAVFASAYVSYAVDGVNAVDESRLTHHWKRIGLWVRNQTPPDTVIATIPIGAISYFGDRRVIDMLGIVDHRIAHEGKLYPDAAPSHGRYLTDYLFKTNPDLVIYGGSAFLAIEGYRGLRFRHRETISKSYGYALFDFVNDPRCADRYDHIVVPFQGGSFVEMQKRKGFSLNVPYREAPSGW